MQGVVTERCETPSWPDSAFSTASWHGLGNINFLAPTSKIFLDLVNLTIIRALKMMLTKATIVHLILPCVSALIDGQIVTPHHAVNHSGVVTMQVHRKATNSSQHGANRRQIDIGLDDPFYGLSYYVNCKYLLVSNHNFWSKWLKLTAASANWITSSTRSCGTGYGIVLSVYRQSLVILSDVPWSYDCTYLCQLLICG